MVCGALYNGCRAGSSPFSTEMHTADNPDPDFKAKSAAATKLYLDCMIRDAARRGFKFEWGKSVVCMIVDFHLGQAQGVLQHLIGLFGLEEGAEMYKKLLTGCMSHGGKSGGMAIERSAAEWGGDELADVGLMMKTKEGNNGKGCRALLLIRAAPNVP